MEDRQRARPRRAARHPGRCGAPLDRPATDAIVVSGYYGFGNLGDEAVLAGLLVALRTRAPGARVVVLSSDPDRTRALHAVESHARTPRGLWEALAGARLLISGGGSLVQDVTSARSALYYLGTIFAASARRVPVAVVGQGVGPIQRPWLRRLARRAFNRAALISVRDAGSARELVAMGVVRPIHRGADLAFLLSPATPERVHALLTGAALDQASARVGVAVRAWRGLPDVATLGDAIRRFAEARRAAVAVLPFDRVRDRVISQALAGASGGRLVEADSPADLLGLIGAMDVVVGIRLHALIFAAMQGVAAVALPYDPKISAFVSELGLPGLVPLDAPADRLVKAMTEAWERRAVERERLRAALPALRHAAADGVRAALDLVTSSR